MRFGAQAGGASASARCATRVASGAPERFRPGSRIAALDALRGVLAVLVLYHHFLLEQGDGRLGRVAFACVLAFFCLSGFVLARAYDGRPFAFMVRRLIRLWPLYAACMLAGYAGFERSLPPPATMAWLPFPWRGMALPVDPPAWSLYYEAWMTPLVPVVFWVARQHRAAGLLPVMLSLVLMEFDLRALALVWFSVGAAAARIEFPPRRLALDRRWRTLAYRASSPLVWLGKVSFSLYLSHQMVLHAGALAFGRWGLLAAVPACFVVAWGAWWAVERPSIRLSRMAAGSADGAGGLWFARHGRKNPQIRSTSPGMSGNCGSV